MKRLVGGRAFTEIRCVDSDTEDYVHLGVTTAETPVDITRSMAQADRRICLGNIEYHYFARYSGGTKASGVYELYYIDLVTGLQRGELLGLKWDDSDLKNGVLHVRRQVLRQNGNVVEAPLKTKNSYRSVSLGADAIEVLEQQKKKAAGSEYVFPSPTGGPMLPDIVLHMLQGVLKRAELERIRSHDLRHTFATLALQNGVDVKTVSGMLGHYSAGFTLDTYAHVTTAAQRNAASAMGNVLSCIVR